MMQFKVRRRTSTRLTAIAGISDHPRAPSFPGVGIDILDILFAMGLHDDHSQRDTVTHGDAISGIFLLMRSAGKNKSVSQ
jgi:hypothetical protein